MIIPILIGYNYNKSVKPNYSNELLESIEPKSSRYKPNYLYSIKIKIISFIL